MIIRAKQHHPNFVQFNNFMFVFAIPALWPGTDVFGEHPRSTCKTRRKKKKSAQKLKSFMTLTRLSLVISNIKICLAKICFSRACSGKHIKRFIADNPTANDTRWWQSLGGVERQPSSSQFSALIKISFSNARNAFDLSFIAPVYAAHSTRNSKPRGWG